MQKRRLGNSELEVSALGAASVAITAEDLEGIERSAARITVQGARLPEEILKFSGR